VNLCETVDSRMLLGSSPERSFLAQEIAYWAGLTREALKRETGGIRSVEISGGGSGWSQDRIGDFRESRVHLNSLVSHFRRNVTFLCELSRIGISVTRIRIMCGS